MWNLFIYIFMKRIVLFDFSFLFYHSHIHDLIIYWQIANLNLYAFFFLKDRNDFAKFARKAFNEPEQQEKANLIPQSDRK